MSSRNEVLYLPRWVSSGSPWCIRRAAVWTWRWRCFRNSHPPYLEQTGADLQKRFGLPLKRYHPFYNYYQYNRSGTKSHILYNFISYQNLVVLLLCNLVLVFLRYQRTALQFLLLGSLVLLYFWCLKRKHQTIVVLLACITFIAYSNVLRRIQNDLWYGINGVWDPCKFYFSVLYLWNLCACNELRTLFKLLPEWFHHKVVILRLYGVDLSQVFFNVFSHDFDISKILGNFIVDGSCNDLSTFSFL